MSHRKLIIGNWKMNPETFDEAKRIARKTRSVAGKLGIEVVACPPFPFIPACISRWGKDSLHLGAQSVSVETEGAHTGEVSVAMLRSLGVEYVIAGHSEEREAGDTDEKVSKRVTTILNGGLMAVVCVGEKVRDDSGAHLEFIKNQMNHTLVAIPEGKAKNIVIAYEPVWAIGAKEAMLPEQIYEMALFVRKVFTDLVSRDVGMRVKVLYGGSVNYKNAGEIVKIGKVDGLLVGRESVNMSGFPDLLKAVDTVS